MIFNKLQFDNIDSKNHGIYITGSAAFNSPSRDAEMVTVPGRNGDLILDNGRYNNIEVTYPAGTFGTTEDDFRDKICNFRNLLASKKGYQRLTDTYNPDEYRMAAFVDAIEVEPVGHNIAGEFDIVFNCKPQRFLTSGETEVTVANNGTITNPTLFASSPLIMVDGYGTINIGNQQIVVEDGTIGSVLLGTGEINKNSKTINYNPDILRTGDTITCNNRQLQFECSNNTISKITGYTVDSITGYTTAGHVDLYDNGSLHVTFGYGVQHFSQGTPKDLSTTINITITLENGTTQAFSATSIYTFDGSDEFVFGYSLSGNRPHSASINGSFADVIGESTLSRLGNPLYIDLDTGEAYKYESGVALSSNSGVNLGSNLPVLAPGNNTITYDNTFTSVKMKPRWWRL